MLVPEEFERWIKASHRLFEIFEGRFDAYPLAIKWVNEWFNSKCFVIEEKQKDRIWALLKNFNYAVYGVSGDLKDKIDTEFKSLTNKYLQEREPTNVGYAVSPYLFTWNFRRFKEYFMGNKDFDSERYFEDLGKFLEGERETLQNFKDLKLVYNQVDKGKVQEIFRRVNTKLREIGIRNNEPVGTIKLLHVFAPYYFPLIDNEIAKNVKLLPTKGISLNQLFYLQWMESLKSWLRNYDMLERLEHESERSILKLVDEGLYIMSSINLGLRIERLGLRVRQNDLYRKGHS